MRFLRFFTSEGDAHLGLKHDGRVLDVTLAARRLLARDIESMTGFMAGSGEGPKQLEAIVAGVAGDEKLQQEVLMPPEGLRLDAPLRDVRKLLALAGNFRQHIVESGFKDVDETSRITPQVFMKPPSTCLTAPGKPVFIREANVFVDWEIELAVIIGCRGRDISREDAMEFVFGYTVLNDVSERNFNARMENRKVREFDPFFDWLMGKWFDGFCPLGPEVVTADEIPDPHALAIRLRVNGQLMQDANTAQMIFDIPTTISYISKVLTLEPGDIIAMGTPSGVGKGRGISLKPGDVMRGEIEGIGVLETPVELAGSAA
ncbi:MAG TPA: fumarylacetoacetate hydrolase family protein [Terriglobia bacterium]|nr:fumarylacetoacetate hydrolase family protein [Terriglobia bacterium]